MVIVKKVSQNAFIGKQISQARSLKRLKIAKIAPISLQTQNSNKPLYVQPICGDRAIYLSNVVSGQNYTTSSGQPRKNNVS